LYWSELCPPSTVQHNPPTHSQGKKRLYFFFFFFFFHLSVKQKANAKKKKKKKNFWEKGPFFTVVFFQFEMKSTGFNYKKERNRKNVCFCFFFLPLAARQGHVPSTKVNWWRNRNVIASWALRSACAFFLNFAGRNGFHHLNGTYTHTQTLNLFHTHTQH
jgi:hypothetical protein